MISEESAPRVSTTECQRDACKHTTIRVVAARDDGQVLEFSMLKADGAAAFIGGDSTAAGAV